MILEAAALVVAATKSSSSSPIFLFLLLGAGALWLIFIRPQRRKQKLQQNMQSDLAVGDEIVTAGGVYGTVTRIDEDSDEVRVEIAPNVEVRLARRAIAAQLTEHEPEAAEEEADPADTSDDAHEPPVLAAESDEKNPG
jgi:preprotein translocase subunit YajC